MNDVVNTILSRRSVRKYDPAPIPDETLDVILNCGIHAPSGGNHQEIVLTVIRNAAILEDIRTIVREEFRNMELIEGQYHNKTILAARRIADYDFSFGAPVLVITHSPAIWPNAMADSALVLENILLSAKALGVGSCYVNQIHWLTDNPRMRDYLDGIGLPKEEGIWGSAVLGISAQGDLSPLPRTPGRIHIVD